MLPGLTRTAAQPASIAAKTYLRLEVDVGDHRDLRLARDRRQRVGVVLASGTATRTIWQPDAVSSAICCSVALTSAVSVVVIDCTDDRRVAADRHRADHDLAARPPRRRAAGGGAAGMPRLISGHFEVTHLGRA